MTEWPINTVLQIFYVPYKRICEHWINGKQSVSDRWVVD